MITIKKDRLSFSRCKVCVLQGNRARCRAWPCGLAKAALTNRLNRIGNKGKRFQNRRAIHHISCFSRHTPPRSSGFIRRHKRKVS